MRTCTYWPSVHTCICICIGFHNYSRLLADLCVSPIGPLPFFYSSLSPNCFLSVFICFFFYQLQIFCFPLFQSSVLWRDLLAFVFSFPFFHHVAVVEAQKHEINIFEFLALHLSFNFRLF